MSSPSTRPRRHTCSSLRLASNTDRHFDMAGGSTDPAHPEKHNSVINEECQFIRWDILMFLHVQILISYINVIKYNRTLTDKSLSFHIT